MSRPPHDSPYSDGPKSRSTAPRHHTGKTAKHSASTSHEKPGPRSRSKRRRRSASSSHGASLTSHPTSRNAYAETRQWLLDQHGPVCAYCGQRFTEKVMTLDHVQPRRGQTAYDRRDNLVLACPACNIAKRDQAPLSFLLASRSRAANLVRYGVHLSPMLVGLARSLAPDEALMAEAGSPYRD